MVLYVLRVFHAPILACQYFCTGEGLPKLVAKCTAARQLNALPLLGSAQATIHCVYDRTRSSRLV